MKKFVAILLCLAMVLALAACQGKEELAEAEKENPVEDTQPTKPAEPTYHHAGYYELIRIESDDPEVAVSEAELELARNEGMYMYLELLEDGTGLLSMGDELALTWKDGTIHFTDDDMDVDYTLENGQMALPVMEHVLILGKGEKPEAVRSEMGRAGFLQFMELGAAYPYTAYCYEDDTKLTTAEAKVTGYEVFESAEGYAPMDGYEWRVVKMEVRYYDENAQNYGTTMMRHTEDYFHTKLHDNTETLVEETGDYARFTSAIEYDGKQMEIYTTFHYNLWGDWYYTDDGGVERIGYAQWDFLVPVGYNGCVAGLRDGRVELQEDAYITDCNPADFLLFRAN